jgi:hypothetical protein
LLEQPRMAHRAVRDCVIISGFAVLVATCACGNGGPAPVGPSVSTLPAPAPNPAPPPQPEPPSVVSFGAGQHRVGLAISPGRYFADPSPGCYWERQGGPGGTPAERIAFGFVAFDAAQWIVDIAGGDYAFSTNEACGTWSNRPRGGPQSELSPGAWLVGAQALPSLYRAAAGSGCYWERLRDFGGSPNSVIARGLVAGEEPVFVSIAADDAGFSATADCRSWIRIDTFVTSKKDASVH